MTSPEVVSTSVTRAEFLLCPAACWKSADPAMVRLPSLRVLTQKQQFSTESRKCCDKSKDDGWISLYLCNVIEKRVQEKVLF